MSTEKIHALHRQERDKYFKYIGSRYYDYPDGEDLLGKLSFTTKAAFYTSSIFGLINSTLPPFQTTLKGKMLRYVKVVVPAVGMAATFTFVTYYATVFRKKDDQLNYALGGAAAGLLLGPSIGIPSLSGWAAVYFAAIGVVKKSVQLNGETLIPDVKRQYWSSYILRNFDTSILPEIKGNWTKEPAK